MRKVVLQVNLGGLLAWEFLLFHWVEVRRWQDIQNHHSVDEDPIFKGNKVSRQQRPWLRSYSWQQSDSQLVKISASTL